MTHARVLSRRGMLGAAGVAGAGLIVARTPVNSLFGGDAAQAATSCASLTPTKTIGPYFVEEKLNRPDITTDPDTGAVVAGVPLALTLTLLDEDNACAPLSGAQVDIWHASPAGLYSDEAGEGTSGKQYLRGYQVSDSSGTVNFTTVYPGWYSGRAVHIHARVRTFDSSGAVKTDFISQMFFEDTLTDRVFTRTPYSTRGTRDTRNAGDNVYGSDGASLILTMTATGSGGYRGSFVFGLSASNQSSGDASAAPGGGGSPGSQGAQPPGGAAPARSTKDTSVAASLAAASCTRGALGARTVHARVRSSEAVSLDARLLRGSRVVSHTETTVSKGSHTISIPVARSVAAGRVTLSVTAKDGAKNSKVLSKILTIPARSA